MKTLDLLDEPEIFNVRRAYLNECVVEQEHGCSQVPDPGPAIVEHLANVTHVSEFRVTETEFPSILLSLILVLDVRVTYQTSKDVYSTDMATTTVMIRPGTKPKMEYEYGNDMIARHMYSEKRSAAVCHFMSEYYPLLRPQPSGSNEKRCCVISPEFSGSA